MPTDTVPASVRRFPGRNYLDRYSKGIITLALVARVLTIFLVWHALPAAWFYSQASELGEVAQSINSGHGLASPFGGNTGPSAFLPPGYPILVAVLFHIFGAYSRSTELVLLILQACFGSMAVLFLMVSARELFGRTTGNIAGLVCALHPWLIALSFIFWETSFSLMMLMLLVAAVVFWLRQPTKYLAFAVAIAGFLAISVNGSLALVCVALFSWAAYKGKVNRKQLIFPAVLFGLLCGIWPLRNAIVMHAFIPLRDNLSYELWQGNRLGGDGFFAPELHPNANVIELNKYVTLGELGYMRQKALIAKAAILSSPLRFLGLTGKRLLYFWLGVSRRLYLNQIAIASLTSLFGVIGVLVFARRRRFGDAMPALIPLLLFPLPYYFTHPDFRFWCLLSPLLTAFAVYAVIPNERAADQPLS